MNIDCQLLGMEKGFSGGTSKGGNAHIYGECIPLICDPHCKLGRVYSVDCGRINILLPKGALLNCG